MTSLHLLSLDLVGSDTYPTALGRGVELLAVEQVLHDLWPQLVIIEKLPNFLRSSLHASNADHVIGFAELVQLYELRVNRVQNLLRKK